MSATHNPLDESITPEAPGIIGPVTSPDENMTRDFIYLLYRCSAPGG